MILSKMAQETSQGESAAKTNRMLDDKSMSSENNTAVFSKRPIKQESHCTSDDSELKRLLLKGHPKSKMHFFL